MSKQPSVIPFEQLRMTDVEQVGGKNASLGEMISQLAEAGVRVPGGFATTAAAYRDFLAESGLGGRINQALDALDTEDVTALAETGARIRQWIMDAPVSFAVRSSATAEDLPDASFAGQQETFLNVHGVDNVLEAIRQVFASLYNDRAISYRVHKGFDAREVALSAACSAWCAATSVRAA
jgi:pyruvate, water dikinase